MGGSAAARLPGPGTTGRYLSGLGIATAGWENAHSIGAAEGMPEAARAPEWHDANAGEGLWPEPRADGPQVGPPWTIGDTPGAASAREQRAGRGNGADPDLFGQSSHAGRPVDSRPDHAVRNDSSHARREV